MARYVGTRDRSLGFHIYVQAKHLHFHQSVRLYGINAPELATDAGKASQKALVGLVPVGTKVVLTTWLDRNDKYGRVLAGVRVGQTDVNQWMIDNGWAVAWDGKGPKPT